MKVNPHPRFKEFSNLIRKAAGLAVVWKATGFRSVVPAKADPVEILSGQGSLHNGGRWNAPGSVRAVYASVTPEVATSETMAYYRYHGFKDEEAMPRLMVAIRFKLAKVLDLADAVVRRKLKVSLADICAEHWRKIQDRGQESLTQAIGRAAFTAGFEALIVPSAQVPKGINVVYFPDNKRRDSVARVLPAKP